VAGAVEDTMDTHMHIHTKNAVRVALRKSLVFFENRDKMNSVIHLAEVRWSPITELVRSAIDELELDDEQPKRSRV
jgi:hypothetical protein